MVKQLFSTSLETLRALVLSKKMLNNEWRETEFRFDTTVLVKRCMVAINNNMMITITNYKP